MPELKKWPAQFKSLVGNLYRFRGAEVTVKGTVRRKTGRLYIAIPGIERCLLLAPLKNKLQWDFKRGCAQEPDQMERSGYGQLAIKATPGTKQIQVTGPLKVTDKAIILEVRTFAFVHRKKREMPPVIKKTG